MNDELLRRDTDRFATRVLGLANLDHRLLKRSLRQCGRGQQIRLNPTDNWVACGEQLNQVTALVRGVESAIQVVTGHSLQGLRHRLRQVLRVLRTDVDVLAVLNQDLRQGKRQTIHVVGIALDVQLTAFIVGHWLTIRQYRRCAEAIQNGFFVIRARRAILFREDFLVLIGTLVIHAIKGGVQQRLNNRAELGTSHDCTSHF